MDQRSSMKHMPTPYYGATRYQSAQILSPVAPGTFQQPPTSSYANVPALSLSARLNQSACHHQKQREEVERAVDFRNHSLPLARIKKIMKSDEDVRMISAEAPVVFAKACEMFINELTLRAWNHTHETKRRTLQKKDIAAAITRTDIFDFLIDILPRDELKEDHVINLGIPTSPLSVGSCSSNAGVANSFPNKNSAPHGASVGKTMHDSIYMQQPRSFVVHMENMLRRGHMHT